MKWKPLLIGAGIGAVVAVFAGAGSKGGARNPVGITGRPNTPFQRGIDTGQGVRGG